MVVCKGAVDGEKKNTTVMAEVVFAGLFSSRLIVILPYRPELSRTTPGGDCLPQRCNREGEVVGTFVQQILRQRVDKQPGAQPTHTGVEAEVDRRIGAE